MRKSRVAIDPIERGSNENPRHGSRGITGRIRFHGIVSLQRVERSFQTHGSIQRERDVTGDESAEDEISRWTWKMDRRILF